MNKENACLQLVANHQEDDIPTVCSECRMLFDNGIMEKWLSTYEAAKLMGISPNALRILVFRGRVKAYKLGARLRFKVSDLCASLNRKEVHNGN